MVENNLKLLLSEKLDFDSEEISDKLLSFDLKKLVKKKYLIRYLENTGQKHYLLH